MYTMGGGLINIFIALSLVNWAGTARIVRSQTLSLKEKEYVEAARSIGVKKVGHHVPAHSAELHPVPDRAVYLKYPVSDLVGSILKLPGRRRAAAECQLGPDGCSRQKKYLFSEPWLSIAPSVAIMIVVMAFNFLGGWPPGCAGPIFKRTVKERRDEHE